MSALPSNDVLSIALIVPQSGPAGIYGPSCEACANMAIAEANQAAGLLGREIRLILLDGSRAPAEVAADVAKLIDVGQIHAVTGWHISPVRQAVAQVTAGRLPYVYAPLYEGGETTPGVFLTGETPSNQLLPGMDWLTREHGKRDWFIVGNDYIWPRATGSAARRHAAARNTPLRGESYLPLGTSNFSDTLEAIEYSKATAVISLLVGNDGVQFNRQFAARGLDTAIPRLSPHLEENMLLASGSRSNNGLYATAGYFDALNTANGMEFSARYHRRFGPTAPALNSIGESCYEAMTLLLALVTEAQSLRVIDLHAATTNFRFISPRGERRMAGNHVAQDVYIAAAVGLDFDVQARIATA